MKFRNSLNVGCWLAAIALSLPLEPARAIDWIGTTADMNDPANWGGTLPTAGFSVFRQTGNHNPVMNSAFATRTVFLDEDAVTPYTITGTGVLSITQVGLGSNGGYISNAADVDLTIDVAELNLTRSNGLITGDYSTSSLNSGTGNLIIGSPGSSMQFKWGGGSTSHVAVISASATSPNAGTSITIYPKLDFSTATSTTSSNRLELRPGATSTIKLLGGITGGPTPSSGNPSKLITTRGVAGGKTILGDSTGWLGYAQIFESDLEITHSNSLGNPGNYTEIQDGTRTGALRLNKADADIVTPETIYIYGRTTTNNPQIRNISGNNTLSGDVLTDSTASGYAMISSDGLGDGNFLTVQGNITRTGTGSGSLVLMGAGNGKVSGVIGNTGTGVWNDVQKSGGGTWELTNANTYTGSTTVSGGKLVLSSTGSINNTSSINVKSGATFDFSAIPGGTFALTSSQSLTGAGSLVGSINATSGTVIAPGDSGNGALGISGSLELSDSVLQMQLGNSAGGLNDKINVGGALTANGLTTIAVTMSQGVLGNGTYHLIDYSGPAVNTANFNLSGITLSPRQTSAELISVTNQLNLVVVGGPATLTWVGGNNADSWDVGVTADNWSGAADTHFYDGDLVVFGNTGTTGPNVNSNVAPGSVSFTNSSGHDYGINGGGGITVAGDMTASGSGSATFSNSSVSILGNLTKSGSGNMTFASSGGTTVAGNVTVGGGGTVEISNGSFATTGSLTTTGATNVNVGGGDFTIGGPLALNGTGTVTIANSGTFTATSGIAVNSGTLAFNMLNGVSISTSISGAGQISKQGSNAVTLDGNNSGYSGAIQVAAGTLKAGFKNANAIGTGTVNVQEGATFDLNAAKLLAGVVSIAGTGADGFGALVDYSAAGTAAGNRGQLKGIVLTANASIGSSPNSYPFIDGAGATFQGNGHDLTMNGTGEWDFYNTGETHLANITLNDGATYFGGTTTLGDAPGVVRLQNNGRLGLDSSPAVAKDIVVEFSNGAIESFNSDNSVNSQITLNGTGEIDVFSLTAYSDPSTITRTMTLNGKLTGGGNLVVHSSPRAGTAAQKATRLGKVVLTSNDNDYTGTTTIGGGGGYSNVAAEDDRVTLSVGNGGLTGKLGTGDVVNYGTLQFNRNDTYSVANTISGTGNVTADAAGGVVTLTGNNSYSGTTTINAGTLSLGSTGSIASTAQIDVKAGATFDVSSQSGFTIGASVPQILKGDGSVMGSVTIAAGSTLAVDYAGSMMDSLAISGSLTITGSTIDFNDIGGELTGSAHVIATYGSLFGTFGTTLDLPAGYTLNYSYLGNQIALVAANLPGDFDGDGDIDGADFVAWQTNFPTTTGASSNQGDADGDNDVDGADFAAWQSGFPTSSGQGSSPVPEPAGFIIAAIGGLVVIVRKRWVSTSNR